MKKSLFGLVALLLAAIVFIGCPVEADSVKELTAGPAISVAASDTTANVTFTGASGLNLTKTDFAVSSGGTISGVSVNGDTATISVSFAANTDATSKTYTVSIASGSAVIKGGAAVVITQAAVSASDTRVELTTGSAANVAASATTATVTFIGASGLSLSAADFAVDNGASVTNVSVSGNTATVSVSFEANTDATPKTYTVSIASGSTKIKGNTTVLITQVKVGDTPDTRKELTAGPAVDVAASSATATVTFTGASGLSLSAADFTVDNGASVTNASVSGNTATVSVSFAANTGATPKTYTVSIASGSVVIKGGATVSITQNGIPVNQSGITAIPPAIPGDAVIDLTGPTVPVAWLNGTITASVDNYQEFTGFSVDEVFTGSYSGDAWILLGDGSWRQSPYIEDSQTTKTRYNFTSTGVNASLVIQLYVSSESNYDFAFVGNLDSTASMDSYYDKISGSTSTTITISVPTAGSHFVEIGYGKDGSAIGGGDCAWFTLAQYETGAGISWYLDGVEVEGPTSALSLPARNYALGTHHLTVIATKNDGKSYSKTVDFTIVKE